MVYTNKEQIEKELQKLTRSNIEIAKVMLTNIIGQLPSEYINLINDAFSYKRIPKEYMLSSIFFTVVTSTGLVFYLDALGYKNYSNLYFTVIGSRGDAKSEAIKIATKPIKECDDGDYDDYQSELETSSQDDEVSIKRKQILIQNATIEAAHKIHSDNPSSVGILIDEIFALIDKMGNSSSRDGVAWRNFLLEGYTNGYIDISRKTTESFRIKESSPTLLGGLQHQFVPKLFANGNLESGLIDRLLFTPKLTSNDKLSLGKISVESINNYSRSIKNILGYKRQSEMPEEPTKQFKIKITKEAERTLFDYIQSLINRQLSAKNMIKEYMSKMQISIHKLCIMVFIMKHSNRSNFASSLLSEDVELAIEINEFYLINFNIIIEMSAATTFKEPSAEEIIKVAKKNNASQKAVAEVTGLHKGTISKKWND